MPETTPPQTVQTGRTGSSLKRGFFLVVARDDSLAQALGEPIQRYSVVRRARCYKEAISMLNPDERWSGVLVDVDTFDGDTVVALSYLREANPLIPVLAVASRADAALVNGLHAFRGELVLKPVGEGNVVSFVQRALVSGWLPDERVAAWVDQLAKTRGLTPHEVQLIAYALGNESRQRVIRRLGITENTLKTQVRSLLRKCDARSMDSLAKRVLRDALVFETEPDAEVEGAELNNDELIAIEQVYS